MNKAGLQKTVLRVIMLVTLAFGLSLAAFHRTMYSLQRSPTGAYYAEITYYTWQSWIPMMPGQSGDKDGFVELFHSSGESLGRIPVAMINSAEVTWTKSGATVRSQGEWDVTRGTCWYWDDRGGTKIYVRGAP